MNKASTLTALSLAAAIFTGNAQAQEKSKTASPKVDEGMTATISLAAKSPHTDHATLLVPGISITVRDLDSCKRAISEYLDGFVFRGGDPVVISSCYDRNGKKVYTSTFPSSYPSAGPN